jgi:hypothetical protein
LLVYLLSTPVELMPNAGGEPPLEAQAEPPLKAVASSAWFGGVGLAPCLIEEPQRTG